MTQDYQAHLNGIRGSSRQVGRSRSEAFQAAIIEPAFSGRGHHSGSDNPYGER